MSTRRGRIGQLFLALLAFVPPLLTAPGQVAADTKQYLYLNPGQLMRTATSLWDPAQFGGYVTHQTVGYLWPAGPWYWLLDRLGLPDWIAQRLWLGLLLCAAGQGLWRLCRTLGIATGATLGAAALYQLSPYVLTYANRTSILLAPWAGLGWIMAFTIRGARHGGWRYPALIALVVATVGGINATALLLIAIAPLTWLVFAVFVAHEISVKRALATVGQVSALSLVMSSWWLVALAVQSRTGADVLAYSETTQAVSSTSTAPEVLRGLGYWLFYGGDNTGPWNSASTPYVQSPGLILLGFGLVALAMAALVLVERPIRLWLTSLWAIGVVVAVGAHGGSWFAQRLLSGNARSTILLAFRSSTRAVPLILLASALAAGYGLSAMRARQPLLARNLSLATLALAVLQLPAIGNGSLVDRQLRRPEQIPTGWTDAAKALQQRGTQTRVLELPGQEFSAFRWGTTTDQLLPGLMTRPTITRDLLPLGSPQMMDLLLALDNRLQDGTLRPDAIAPVARLMGVGDVVVRGDEQFEKYQAPRPERVARIITTPAGLGAPTSYGPPVSNAGPAELLDPVALAVPNFPQPQPAATLFPVEASVPIVRAEASRASVLLAGSGDGVVAAADLLPPGALVRYSADAASDQQRREWATDAGLIVITDSNRKRAQQWRGSQNTVGMTEDQSPGVLTVDPADVRLPLFPAANADSQTLALQQGGTVHATAYGEPNAYRPEDRAVMAFDGDPDTFWRVADRANAIGQRIEATFDTPRPAGSFVVRQPPGDRTISQLAVSTNLGDSRLTLDQRSQSVLGQPLDLPTGMISKVTLEVAATTGDGSFIGQNAVGIDVASNGPPITEVVRPPIDLARSVGRGLADIPVAVVLSRERADAASTYRRDPETRLQRVVQLPADMAFTVSGNAHLADRSADGLRGSLSSSGHLEGSEQSRVQSAFDGDPSTRWVAPMGHADGEWLEADLGAARTIDYLDISQPDGDRFSRVDTVEVTLDGTTRSTSVDARGRVSFEAMTGRRLRVTLRSAHPRFAVDPHFNEPVALPAAITDVIVPGWSAAASASLLPSRCRDDLLTIDDRPLPIHVAVDGVISPCAAGPTVLTAGEHSIVSTAGLSTGIDVDRLVFRHDAVAAKPTPAPAVHPTTRSSTETVVQIDQATDRFLLVFGQGWASGWRASLNGRDLGAPVKVDGGSMGWPIDPATTPATVTIHWRPQRIVNVGLLISAIGAVGCLLLAVFGRRRRAVVLPTRSPGEARPFIGALIVAMAAAAVVTPWAALAIGAIAIISRTVAALRRLGLIAAVACIGVTGAFVAGQQFRHRYQPGFGWPQSFSSVHQLALLAVLFLVTDATSAPQKQRSSD